MNVEESGRCVVPRNDQRGQLFLPRACREMVPDIREKGMICNERTRKGRQYSCGKEPRRILSVTASVGKWFPTPEEGNAGS